MDSCISILRGGTLITIADPDLDYQSYKNLGLACPFCNEPVFLRSGGWRNSHGKEIHFRPSFCHFGSKEPTECENRSRSPEWDRFLVALSPESRNQRLRLFNSHFWDLINYCAQYPINAKRICLSRIDRQSYLDTFILVKNVWKDVSWTEKTLYMSIDALSNGSVVNAIIRSHSLNLISDRLKQVYDRWLSDVDIKIQRLICIEAYRFTCSNAGRSCLEKMYAAATFSVLTNPLHSEDRNTNAIFTEMLAQIIYCRWLEAIDAISKKGGIGFGLKDRQP